MSKKICQSCAMPMEKEADFGKNADGTKNEEYCCYCMPNGKFATDETMEQMADCCSKILTDEGMFKSKEEGTAYMMNILPALKRWNDGSIMKYDIVELAKKTVVGITDITSNTAPDLGDIIGGLWKRFYEEGVMASIPNKVNDIAFGLYSDYESDENGKYNITVCTEVSKAEAPAGTVVKTIPAGRYAKFNVKAETPDAISIFWQRLWTIDLDRTYTGDFEEYLSMTEVNVYIAIK